MRAAAIVAVLVTALASVNASADAPDSGRAAQPTTLERASTDGDAEAAVPPAAATPATAAAPAPVTAATPPQPVASAPASSALAESPIALSHAVVHLYVDYQGAWLELKSAVDPGPWQRACAVPCDQKLRVEGMLARVSAPGMTPSNEFRIEPGAGTAQLKVAGGSATARGVGLVSLMAGVPITLAGMGVFGYGSVRDDDGLRIAGAVTLGVGALAVLTALPLLFAGSTSVRDGRGQFVATGPIALKTH